MTEWTQLTASGVLALLLVREFLAFLKAKRANGSGDKSVEYWTQEIRHIVREEVREALRLAAKDAL